MASVYKNVDGAWEIKWAVSSCGGEMQTVWKFKDPYSKSKAIYLFLITVIIDINQAQIFSYRPKIN